MKFPGLKVNGCNVVRVLANHNSTETIGKLLGHKAGSSMTKMYADFYDDEVVDLGKTVPMDAISNLAKI